MQNITLSIALIASSLILIFRPLTGFVVYIAVLFFYPGYLVLQIGTIDIPAMRVAVTVLLIKCILSRKIRKVFQWNKLDTWITAFVVWGIIIKLITCPMMEALENRAGDLMNTLFAYFVTRLCITNRQELVKFIKLVSILFIPLAVIGIIESTTGWQPFAALRIYCPWRPEEVSLMSRWGFQRAFGAFGQPILFGIAFSMFLPLVSYLRHQKNYWSSLSFVLLCIVFIGALTSMSSGPWVMVFFSVAVLLMENYKYLLKPIFTLFVAGSIFIALGSNRPFYHVLISYANPVGGSGWHRARLIDAAIHYFGEWWLVGYGEINPNWGEFLGGVANTDLTNEFVLVGVKYGIAGVILLCGILIVAFRELYLLYISSSDTNLKSLCWVLGCTLASIIVVWISVSFFGVVTPLYYCVMGIIGSVIRFSGCVPNSNRIGKLST